MELRKEAGSPLQTAIQATHDLCHHAEELREKAAKASRDAAETCVLSRKTCARAVKAQTRTRE